MKLCLYNTEYDLDQVSVEKTNTFTAYHEKLQTFIMVNATFRFIMNHFQALKTNGSTLHKYKDQAAKYLQLFFQSFSTRAVSFQTAWVSTV